MDGVVSVDGPSRLGKTYDLELRWIGCHQLVPCSFSRSSCSLARSSGDMMIRYKRLSSANRRYVEDTRLGKSKEEGKDQELIQSITTPDPRRHRGK